MNREEKERLMDETAKKWKAAEAAPGNAAAAMKLCQDVWALAYELTENMDLSRLEQYSTTAPTEHVDANKDSMATLDAITEAMSGYDGERPFSHYLSFLLKKRRIDHQRPAEGSLDAPLSGADEKGGTWKDMLAAQTDTTVTPAELRVILSSTVVEMTSLVLNFFKHHKGKAANENRRRWYRLFYTEDITFLCRVDLTLLWHPTEALSAVDTDYLDYYMSRQCRTGSEIKRTPPKPYCEVVPSSSDRSVMWIDAKFPAEVSLCYLQKATGEKPTASARTGQIKNYRKEIKGL